MIGCALILPSLAATGDASILLAKLLESLADIKFSFVILEELKLADIAQLHAIWIMDIVNYWCICIHSCNFSVKLKANH